MLHRERVQLARKIADQILDKYKQAVVAIAVYGSTAKHEDAEHSDLELWVAMRDPYQSREQTFIYQDMNIEISYLAAGRALDLVRQVDTQWPISADALRSFLILYDRENLAERLRRAAAESQNDAEAFGTALREKMFWAHETMGKLKNAYRRGDSYGVLDEGRRLAFDTAMLIGLANRRFYPGGRGMYQLSKQMPCRPADYDTLVDVVGGFITVEIEQVYRAALQLWDRLETFVAGQGIVWRDEQISV